MKRSLQILNILGFLGTVIVNTLASTVGINNYKTGQLSDEIENLFVPAGLTFAIWGVIYLLLVGFTVYQARDLFVKNQKEDEYVNKIGIWFIIGNVANIVWIFLWHYRLVSFSLLAMLVLLASLLIIYLRLNINYFQKSIGTARTKWDILFYWIPFSVYLGWITIATVANVTAVLADLGWTRFDQTELFWTVLVLAVAIGITLGMVFLRKDLPYLLVIVWAFLGIIIKRIDPMVSPTIPPELDIIITASVGIGLILLAFIYVFIRFLMRKPSST